MSIFSNLLNGSVNYKKVVDDFATKDKSITACYGRNHVAKPAYGYLGILLAVSFVGCVKYAFSDGKFVNHRDTQRNENNNLRRRGAGRR